MIKKPSLFTDFKERRYRETIVLFSIGVIILVVDIFFFPLTKHFNEYILAGITALLYMSILERRAYKLVEETKSIFQVSSFGATRKTLPDLSEIIDSAESEISIYGIKLGDVVQDHILEKLTERVKYGCKLNLLILSLVDKDGNPNQSIQELEDRKYHLPQNYFELIKINTGKLLEWRSNLPKQSQKKIRLKGYVESPNFAFLMIDQSKNNGFVHLELFVPQVSKDEQPNYMVRKLEHPSFFSMHRKIFSRINKESMELN